MLNKNSTLRKKVTRKRDKWWLTVQQVKMFCLLLGPHSLQYCVSKSHLQKHLSTHLFVGARSGLLTRNGLLSWGLHLHIYQQI